MYNHPPRHSAGALKTKDMKTLLTTLWAVPLAALLSILFYLIGEALIELAEWINWRLKLQIKRTKEARRARRSKNNLKPRI